MKRVDFRFYLITDRHQTLGRDLVSLVQLACRHGVRAVQVREKDLSARELCELVQELQEICRQHKIKLLVNDRVDVALASHADGVHLTAHSLPAAVVRTLLPRGSLVGVSTHSLEEARRAETQGPDFILFGPVFATPSKLKFGPPQGLERLKQVAEAVRTPVFAVGGVSPARTRLCLEHGAAGVAAISSVMQAPNPAEILEQYRLALSHL